MKKWKNNLDEMQEQNLLKLEHRVCWLAYWLLIAAILVQYIFTDSMEAILGETVVLLIMCFYLSIGCLRLGIWDRRLKTNWKTNLIGSLIAGSIVGIVSVVHSIRSYGYYGIGTTALIFLMPFVFTCALTFGAITLCSAIYRKRKEKLEQE